MLFIYQEQQQKKNKSQFLFKKKKEKVYFLNILNRKTHFNFGHLKNIVFNKALCDILKEFDSDDKGISQNEKVFEWKKYIYVSHLWFFYPTTDTVNTFLYFFLVFILFVFNLNGKAMHIIFLSYFLHSMYNIFSIYCILFINIIFKLLIIIEYTYLCNITFFCLI